MTEHKTTRTQWSFKKKRKSTLSDVQLSCKRRADQVYFNKRKILEFMAIFSLLYHWMIFFFFLHVRCSRALPPDFGKENIRKIKAAKWISVQSHSEDIVFNYCIIHADSHAETAYKWMMSVTSSFFTSLLAASAVLGLSHRIRVTHPSAVGCISHQSYKTNSSFYSAAVNSVGIHSAIECFICPQNWI